MTDYDTTIPQGTLLKAREEFTCKIGRATIHIKPGQSFWVVNTRLNQQSSGIVHLARAGKLTVWHFTRDDVERYFTLAVPASQP